MISEVLLRFLLLGFRQVLCVLVLMMVVFQVKLVKFLFSVSEQLVYEVVELCLMVWWLMCGVSVKLLFRFSVVDMLRQLLFFELLKLNRLVRLCEYLVVIGLKFRVLQILKVFVLIGRLLLMYLYCSMFMFSVRFLVILVLQLLYRFYLMFDFLLLFFIYLIVDSQVLMQKLLLNVQFVLFCSVGFSWVCEMLWQWQLLVKLMLNDKGLVGVVVVLVGVLLVVIVGRVFVVRVVVSMVRIDFIVFF